MNADRLTTTVQAITLLLRGAPPHQISFDSDLMIRLLKHHDLDAAANYWIEKIPAWKLYFTKLQLASLTASEIQAKVRYHLVLGALKDALQVIGDLQPVLFKGLAVCQVYPAPHLRNPGDIDFLMPINYFERAVDRLMEAGWKLEPSVHRDCPPEIARRYGFALIFRHPTSPVILDLHRAPVDKTEPFWIEPEDLFQFTPNLQISVEVSVASLAVEDHLALLALHSVRHGFFRLIWFYDVHLASEKWGNSLNREIFRQRCERWHISRAVRVGREISRRLFPTQVLLFPDIPLDVGTRRSIARRNNLTIMRCHLVNPGSWRRLAAMIDLLDNRWLAFRYLMRTVFPSRSLFATNEKSIPSIPRYLKDRLLKIFQFRRDISR